MTRDEYNQTVAEFMALSEKLETTASKAEEARDLLAQFDQLVTSVESYRQALLSVEVED